MKRISLLVTLLSITFLFTGCGTLKTNSDRQDRVGSIKKRFFNGTIIYEMASTDVMQVMGRMENLQKQKFELFPNPKEPGEEDIVKLYRDADSNRDRFITQTESQTLQTTYTFDFEDSLGYLE